MHAMYDMLLIVNMLLTCLMYILAHDCVDQSGLFMFVV
jgi:hypothetical protein